MRISPINNKNNTYCGAKQKLTNAQVDEKVKNIINNAQRQIDTTVKGEAELIAMMNEVGLSNVLASLKRIIK